MSVNEMTRSKTNQAYESSSAIQNPLLPKHFHEIPHITIQKWMAPVPNMVDVFNSFKQMSFDLFKNTGTLFTPLQVMALNNIFFFSPSTARDYMIPLENWEQVVTDCRDKYQVYSVSDDEDYQLGLDVKRYAMKAYYSFSRINDYLNTLRGSDMNPCVFRMLENISRRISHHIDHTQTKDSFTLNVVDPILNAFFNNSIPYLQYQGNGYEIPESRARKVEQAYNKYQDESQVSGRKADRSAFIDISNHQDNHTAYICKIETEATSNYGADLPEIAAILKDILNEALECNMSNQEYCAVGILIEGSHGTVLAMDLPYPKMYRLIELDTFSLPREMRDLRYLGSVVKPLLNMKELVKKNVGMMLPLQYTLSSTSSFSSHDIMTESNKSPVHYTEYYS